MSVPGSNLLALALTAIEPQLVRYFRDAGRTTNVIGNDTTDFAPGVDVEDTSLQAVPLTRYESMGLDYTKRYVSWFVSLDVVGVARDRSGDEFEWNGRRYQITAETNWFVQDGWTCVTGVDIGPA